MRPFIILIALIVAAVPVGSWAAQPDADKQTKSVFQQLFPNPTGKNGYEDLVRAGEIVRDNKMLNDALNSAEPMTLTLRRMIVGQLDMERALNLVHKGLNKPIVSPRAGKMLDASTLVPDLGLMRGLGRLLMIEQYVDMADGRMGDAISSVWDGLRLGYNMQSEVLIGGLVGIAIDSMAIKSLSDHLDQLSARDCDKLVELAKEWMGLEDPQIACFKSELAMLQGTLDKARTDPSTMDEVKQDLLQSSKDNENYDVAEVNELVNNKTALDAAIRESKQRIGAFGAAVIGNLKRPTWERRDISVGTGTLLSNIIIDKMMPTYNKISERFVKEQAQVQLLGVHAAIRRYRWEYGKLPASLNDLKVNSLAIDPFNGKQLIYKITSEKTYELTSAGPFDRDEDGRQLSTNTAPITLTPGDKKP